MGDVWTDLNKEIPNYFRNLAEKYSLEFVCVSNRKTALIANKYALVVSIDRFAADVEYVFRNEDGELTVLGCDNYFAEQYDNDDRRNLLQGNGIKETIINNFIVMNHGLIHKWEPVLSGDRDWIKDFQTSKWHHERKCTQAEKNILEKFI